MSTGRSCSRLVVIVFDCVSDVLCGDLFFRKTRLSEVLVNFVLKQFNGASKNLSFVE